MEIDAYERLEKEFNNKSYKQFEKEIAKQIMKMKEDIKHLPKLIRKLAEKRLLKRPEKFANSGFTWSDTPEGKEFWKEVIINRNYKLFYEMYPNKSKNKQSIEELIEQADINYVFGCTAFNSKNKMFLAVDYRAAFYSEKAKKDFDDLLPTLYASSLKKVIKKAISI
jgi:hypothetical protein